MKHLLATLITKLNGTKLGLGVLAALSGGTALALLPYDRLTQPPPAAIPSAVAPAVATDDQGVRIQVRPSQTKVVQGSADEVYLDVDIEVPTPTVRTGVRKPTDMVLVLDRSGSMADGAKLDYAKAAMRTLVERLGDQDGIALVTFDDVARVDFPLTAATPEARQRLLRLAAELGPGSSTNMGDGLEKGRRQLATEAPGRSMRVILLSDGMANAGIADPEGLTAIVKSIGRSGAVVSTIGMGLDFNETLLARLADHGMGNYSYLASLVNLGQLLEKDLGDAREQFAGASHLLLDVGEGVTVTDAAGYPIERAADGRVRVPLGQLLEGTARNLTLSLKMPTHVIGERRLAAVELTYDREGKTRAVRAGSDAFAVNVVPPERGAEAVASIDAGVLKKSWVANNAGRMKKEFSNHMRDGNQAAAQRVLNEYRGKLGEVAKATGVDTKDEALEGELKQLEHMAQDAFVGSAAEQDMKKKAYSKESWSSGFKSQRTVEKKK